MSGAAPSTLKPPPSRPTEGPPAPRSRARTATPGSVAFVVTNTGTKVNEFYLYEGDAVRGEVENIGPGLTRTLTVDVTAGAYTTACKPGMTGDGIRAPFTVR